MTLDELKEVIVAHRTCPVYWFRGSEVAGNDGKFDVSISINLPKHAGGRFSQASFILLDDECPADELVGIYFHEVGHGVYVDNVPRIHWNRADSESCAYEYGLRELINRELWEPVRLYVENVEKWLEKNRAESPEHEAGILRLQQTEAWRIAKRKLASLASDAGQLGAGVGSNNPSSNPREREERIAMSVLDELRDQLAKDESRLKGFNGEVCLMNENGPIGLPLAKAIIAVVEDQETRIRQLEENRSVCDP